MERCRLGELVLRQGRLNVGSSDSLDGKIAFLTCEAAVWMMCLQEQGTGDGEDGWSGGLNSDCLVCWLFVVLRCGWQALDTTPLE